jgi:hypothetical protein
MSRVYAYLVLLLATTLMLWAGVELVHAFGSTLRMRTEWACVAVVACALLALAVRWQLASPTRCTKCGSIDMHLNNMVGKYGGLVLKTEAFVLAWALILARLEYADMDTALGVGVTYVALLCILLWLATSSEMSKCSCGTVHMRATKSKLVRRGTILNRVNL